MKKFNKALAILLICLVMVSQLNVVAFAATTYYEAFEKAPIYTEPYNSSNKVDTLYAGTVVKVVSSTTNSHGNLWYKLDNGYYTYSKHYKKHKHVSSMCGMPSTYYEQNDSSTHIKVYNDGGDLCYCEYVMAKGKTTRTTESHNFNASGNCKACGYHKHTANQSGQASTSYKQLDASYHTVITYKGDHRCSCGAIVKKGETITSKAKHTFNASGNCTACGYHAHKANNCGKSSTSYNQLDASYHTVILYKGDHLCSCGAFVKKGETVTSKEKHNFNASGNCTACGYHAHKANQSGQASTSYKQLDASYHTVITYKGDHLCSCGAFVKKGETVTEKQTHSFNSNNTCSACGYTKIPTHSHKANSTGQKSINYLQKNSSIHIKITYNGDNICSCGYVVSQGTTTKTEEQHYFDSTGKCNSCGYVKQVVQSPTTSTHTHKANQTGQKSISYEQKDSLTHIVVVYDGETRCSCGYIISKGKTTRTNESHKFNGSNNCTACGFSKKLTPTTTPSTTTNSTSIHTHKESGTGISSTSYEQKNNSLHIKVVVSGDILCSCGKVMKKGDSNSSIEYHEFSNGKCTKCGFIEQISSSVSNKVETTASNNVDSNHTHKAVKTSSPKTTYEQYDSAKHIACTHSGDEICSCGYVVDEGEVKKRFESHNYNSYFICVSCGYNNDIIIHEEDIGEVKYITVKDDVPVRSFCRKTSSAEATIAKKGSIVTITKLVTNQYGQTWGVISTGYYIYLENVRKYSEEDVANNNITDSFKKCSCTDYEKGQLIESHITCQENPNYHYLIMKYEKICSDCNQVIYQNDSHKLQSIYHIESHSIPHSFDETNTCVKCGHNHLEYLEKETIANVINATLSLTGMIPYVGNYADGLDLVFSVYRGDTVGIITSAVAMLPVFGIGTGAVKTTENVANIADSLIVIKNADNYSKIVKAINSGSDPVELIKNAKNTDEILSVIKYSGNPTDAAAIGTKSARDILLEAADDQSLKNTIDQLYRPGASVLDGGSADAARYELRTGKAVGDKFHPDKVTNRIGNCNNLLKRDNLSNSDRLIAEALREDLLDAQEKLIKATSKSQN